ncbi:MAG: MAE_28990/MAE_18760 family HEPN-like nuclease [Chthoniobacter sp.]
MHTGRGFVKVASEAYLNYIQFQNLRFRELKTCFIVLGCKKHVSRLVDSGRSSMTIEAVTFLRANMNDFAAFSLASAIDTESNLSSAVFENVATSIGIDTTPYQTKYKYIDINLVEARNKVAHGEIHGIKPEDCRSLCDHVIDLIRRFKTDIQNAVALRRYRN